MSEAKKTYARAMKLFMDIKLSISTKDAVKIPDELRNSWIKDTLIEEHKDKIVVWRDAWYRQRLATGECYWMGRERSLMNIYKLLWLISL